MPFLFLIAGVVMVISAVRDTPTQLIGLVKDDFTGKNNFIFWMLSILVIGGIGYIPKLQPLSRAFLALVVIVLFLKNGGVFTQFVSAVSTTQSNAQPSTTTNIPAALPTLPSLASGTTGFA